MIMPLLNRTVTIVRGDRDFDDNEGVITNETVIAENIQASIQLRSSSPSLTKNYPQGARTTVAAALNTWNIHCAVDKAQVKKRDKVTDDEGREFEVEAVQWGIPWTLLVCRDFAP